MFKCKLGTIGLIATMGLGLFGCSDDSEETTESIGYFQYYNASANSSLTALALDEYTYTGVEFADAMPRYSYSVGTSELSIYGLDADNHAVEIHNSEANFIDDGEHLFVLYGDFHSPEFLDIVFDREQMDELNSDEDNDYSKMQVLAANVATTDESYDVYIGLDTGSFAEASMLGNAAYGQYTSGQLFDTDTYVVYLTTAGTQEVIYTTSSISLTANSVYKLILRPSFGAGELPFVIDVVDSTTTADTYAALESQANINVFNGLLEHSINLTLESQLENQYLYNISAFGVTDFQSIGYNDYAVSITNAEDDSPLLDNLLVTFNQDEIKTILVYPDENDVVKGMVIEQDLRPRPYESLVEFTHLSSQYDDLSVYFVTDSQTIESAQYMLSDFDFEENQSQLLPQDDYQINIVYTTENGTQTLVYQSEMISFSGESHYSFVLSADEQSPYEHRLTQL